MSNLHGDAPKVMLLVFLWKLEQIQSSQQHNWKEQPLQL